MFCAQTLDKQGCVPVVSGGRREEKIVGTNIYRDERFIGAKFAFPFLRLSKVFDFDFHVFLTSSVSPCSFLPNKNIYKNKHGSAQNTATDL